MGYAVLKKLLLKVLYPSINGEDIRQNAKLICQLAFFQKVLRINSKVPWLVHWTSVVTGWENITKIDSWLNPGVSPGCYIQGKNGIRFGRNVYIGPGVKIISANHNLNNMNEHVKQRPVIISDNCWLASNSIILPGVVLQEKTIVAAGAVVVKSPGRGNCLIAGNPAKLVKILTNGNN